MAMSTERAPNVNGARLTNRELEVLGHAVEGKFARQIADDMHISKRTVDFHLDNIYGKLRARNRFEAMRLGLRLGLVKIEVRT